MEWNVYRYNSYEKKIEACNIFEHRKFMTDVKEALKCCTDKTSFSEALKSELQYYFWSRFEWEIIISPLCGEINPDEIKIDVYDQVMLNFDVLVDHVWNNREAL